jgi:hypothetical protein
VLGVGYLLLRAANCDVLHGALLQLISCCDVLSTACFMFFFCLLHLCCVPFPAAKCVAHASRETGAWSDDHSILLCLLHA